MAALAPMAALPCSGARALSSRRSVVAQRVPASGLRAQSRSRAATVGVRAVMGNMGKGNIREQAMRGE